MSGGWVGGQPEWSFQQIQLHATPLRPGSGMLHASLAEFWAEAPSPASLDRMEAAGRVTTQGRVVSPILKSSQREPESPFPLVKRSPALGFAWVSLPPAAQRNFRTWGDVEKARCKCESLPASSQRRRLSNKFQVNSVVISGAAALETLASAGAGP